MNGTSDHRRYVTTGGACERTATELRVQPSLVRWCGPEQNDASAVLRGRRQHAARRPLLSGLLCGALCLLSLASGCSRPF